MNEPKVVHAPTRHAYVDHIQPFGSFPRFPPMRTRQVLEPSWLHVNLVSGDIVHLHFQLQEMDLAQLEASTRLIRDLGCGLMFTVHDLVDPQSEDQDSHRRKLDVLIGRADGLFTLTRGAAADIADLWGRRAAVLPHPHVLPIGEVGRTRRHSSLPVVALHLKSGRPGVLARPVLDVLLESHDPSRWQLRIDVNTDGVERLERREPGLTVALEDAAVRRGVRVLHHERFSEDDFIGYVKAIDVAILPYARGTHSGWAEACLDAGVAVIAPEHTHIPDQHSSIIAFDILNPTTLMTALNSAFRTLGTEPWTRAGRVEQRVRIARDLAAAYSSI